MDRPTGGVERIGMEAYLGLADFNKNLSSYNKSIEAAVSKTEKAAQASGKASAAITGRGGLGGALGSLIPVLGGVGASLISIAGPLLAAGTGLFALGKTVVEVKEMIAEALPMEGVQKAFYALAASAGSSGREMLAAFRMASGGMIDELALMQRFNKAAQLVSLDFAVNLPEAIGYLGKVSAATGESMDYLYNSLITGVGRLSKPILDNLNVMVDLELAYQDWAAANGKVADSLSQTEKQAAVMAQVMAQLRVNTAALTSPTELASGAVAALGAEFANLRRDIGSVFLPAVQAGATALRQIVLRIREAIDVGGEWRVGLVELGAWLKAIVVTIGNFGVSVTEGLIGPLGKGFSGFIVFLGKVAMAAAQWGANIVSALAMGMVSAMRIVLVPVFTSLAKMMAYWLAPGSPPRIAPDIYDWGTAAMGEFIRGMTDADFGALNAIQKPLQEVLDLFAAQGRMEKGEIGPTYVSISKRIIADLQGTGKVTEETLAALRETTGEYAEDVVALVQAELELAQATEAVERAEKALDDARKRRTQTQEELGDAVREYNRLLRMGAPTEKLAGQLAAIRAAEKQVTLAKQQEQAAEANVETERDGLDALEESVQVRRAALDEMLEMARALIPPIESVVKALKEVADAVATAIEVPEPVLPKIDFGVMFAGLSGEINERSRTIEFELWKTIQRITGFGGPLDHLKAQIELMRLTWQYQMEKAGASIDALGQKIDDLRGKWDNLVKALTLGVLPKLVDVGKVIAFLADIQIEQLNKKLIAGAQMADVARWAYDRLAAAFNAESGPIKAVEALIGRVDGLKEALEGIVSPAFREVVRRGIEMLFDPLGAIMTWASDLIGMLLKVLEVYNEFTGLNIQVPALEDLRKWLDRTKKPPVPEEEKDETAPRTGGSRIATGTKNFIGGLALVGERGPELVVLPKGSTVFTASETARMLRQDYAHPDRSLVTYTDGLSQPSKMVNLTFGDVRIANDMDWVTFKAGVHKAVLEGIA